MQLRNRGLVRTLGVERTLVVGSRSISAVATEFGVTTRTIRRDLAALEEAGFRLVVDDDRRWHVLRRREVA